MLTVSALVLAYGDEPWIERCVDALLMSRGVDVDVVLVDNGCTTGAPGRLAGRDRVAVLTPEVNLGFAGGCNLAATAARGEFLALVNGDALVDPDALAALVGVARDPSVGIATGSIRLSDHPDQINSVGNPVHFSGLSWAGGFGDPASDHQLPTDVASASGAGMVMRRGLWEQLQGFAPEYFAYLEDTELSLRCWQRGLRVVYVPDAVVVHRYEFSRSPLKNYLLERNRLLLIATVYERRTLVLLAPALLLVEASLLVLALAQGWGDAKVRGWLWLLRHRAWIRSRRRQLQSERLQPDSAVADLLTDRMTMANLERPAGLDLLDRVLARYWRSVRPRL
ncbi:MAG: glycosyl transferase family 2 [Frankiales bacterium]|nr:glycosyl transferase family 2 [Frankiales bacterium]